MAEESIWTIKAALDFSVGFLSKYGDEHPRLSSEWLLAYATGLSRVEVYTNFDKPLSKLEKTKLREALKRRAKGEPLQYVSGETAFRHIVVKAEPGVLIPRPETEMLVEYALEKLKQYPEEASGLRVLEVGTGSGCISCALADELEHVAVYATDISPVAVELAKRNRDALGYTEDIVIVETNLADSLEEQLDQSVDLLISNPPYIPSQYIKTLPKEVSLFEPHLALDGGADGLDIFRELVALGLKVLKADGIFICELHEETLDAAKNILDAQYKDVEILKDLVGRPRFVYAKRP